MAPGNRKVPDPIPSGPWQRWLNDRIAESSTTDVLELIGWGGEMIESGKRRLYRHRYGRMETHRGGKNGRKGNPVVVDRETVSRAVVEDALHHAGWHLEDVYPVDQYPAVHTDIPAEAEAWCPGCQRMQQPVIGHCITCDWRITDEGLPLEDAA